MRQWSTKYPPQEQVLREPAQLDAFVVGTQAANNAASAHAFEIHISNSDRLAIPTQVNVSEGSSKQERACLSAIVRTLQFIAPGSRIRVICRLENVVEAINRTRKLRANADIFKEITALEKAKSIRLWATRASNDGREGYILSGLLQKAKAALALSIDQLAVGGRK